MDLKEKIKSLPTTPGVYIMRGAQDDVLYVGKAANLRKRVSSYFRTGRAHSARIELMVGKVRDITFVPTATEAEALIYENGLIKELAPRYNVALRDDKSYPLLKLTVNEPFPRLFVTRTRADDGAAYYGPYADAGLLKEAVAGLRQLFPLRTCSTMGKRPCLNFHINQCLAPCAGRIDEKAYGEMIEEIKLFLAGRRNELLRRVTDRMLAAAAGERFEEAGLLKARLDALGLMKEKAVRYGPLGEVEELGAVIGLASRPEVIEAFDISNIMGTDAVGSMVTFTKGRPDKDRYRKFRIRAVAGIDDYAMIREVVRRRYARVLEEGERLPDLILIDGGKGHLAAAAGELAALGLEKQPVISIAKEFEHIFVKGRPDPVILPRESKALHLVQRIRDEAHRFAITYHQQLAARRTHASELDGVPGIGPKRKRALLARFGSVEAVRAAGLEELMQAEGMNERAARAVIDHFKQVPPADNGF